MRRERGANTGIVATLGPATAARPGDVIAAGATTLRVNTAHGEPDDNLRAIAIARQQAADLGQRINVLVDLPGPKLRVGPIEGDETTLHVGAPLRVTSRPLVGNAEEVSATAALPELVAPGDHLYLADGEIVLGVLAVDPDGVSTRVRRGGTLRSGKGLVVPGAETRLVRFTAADATGLELAAAANAELVGVSFVTDATDVARVRSRLPGPEIVAKIETRAALDHLDEIIAAADAVMVARGDLAVSIDIARIAIAQKEIVARSLAADRPVMVATQLLHSMTASPLPTRAEVSDVANAVLDGATALVLSDETAVGSYPPQAVAMAARIAAVTEEWAYEAAAVSPSDS